MSVNQNYSIKASISTGRRFHINEPANNNFPLLDLGRRLGGGRRDNTSDNCTGKSVYFLNFLTNEQLNAANNLYLGFQLYFNENNLKIQTLDGATWRGFVHEKEKMDLILRFEGWMEFALDQGLSIGAVEEILFLGGDLQSADKSFKKENGFAKKNLTISLDLYLNDF